MKQKSKNIISSIKKTFKKEGFYVTLFVTLSIVTIVGAITIKNKDANSNSQAELPSAQDVTLNQEDKNDMNTESNKTNENKDGKEDANTNVETSMENSERVENKPASKPVGSDSKMNFSNPVEGKLLKGHNEPYIFKDGKAVKEGEKGDSSLSYGGISVGAKMGTAVKAAEDGVIEDVIENDVTYGVTVIIKHANGIKTSYANLSNDLKVKKDDKVTKGQEIGKVGNTASTLKLCVKDDFLHIKVYSKKDNTYSEVDPLKYFAYKK